MTDAKKPAKRKKRPTTRPEPDKDWFRDRMDSLEVSQSELAKELALEPAAVSRTLAGRRTIKPNELSYLAKFLKTSATEILRRLGYDAPRSKVPLAGKVTADARVSTVFDRKGQFVAAPSDLEGDTEALTFQTQHSPLGAYDGYLVFYYPSNQIEPDAFGRLSIVSVEGENMPVLGVIERGSAGKVRVVLFGGVGELTTKKVLSATPIRWLGDPRQEDDGS